MKLHTNASLTPKQRQQIKDLYTTGEFIQEELATKFGVTRKTISKWVHSPSIEDSSNTAHKAKTITAEFTAAVKAYREDVITIHHGKVRIAFALKNAHGCSNPSNVYSVLKQLKLNQPKKVKQKTIQQIPVGKHRTQMDVQVLPAIEGSDGFEFKISIIHLSTRIKYSEIHSDYSSKTIASVYERALDNLPPFL